MSICWYNNDEVKIVFDKIPNLAMRFAMPSMSSKEIEEINKKPFVCIDELKVILTDEVEQENY